MALIIADGDNNMFRMNDDGTNPSFVVNTFIINSYLSYWSGNGGLLIGRSINNRRQLRGYDTAGASVPAFDGLFGIDIVGLTINGNNLFVLFSSGTNRLVIQTLIPTGYGTAVDYPISGFPDGSLGYHASRELCICDNGGAIHTFAFDSANDRYNATPTNDFSLGLATGESVLGFDINGSTAFAVINVPAVPPPNNSDARTELRTYTVL